MELDRKAFHFDLDNKSVERFYTGKKNPWSDIQDFLESHCFEKPQYSGYESAENIVMSYQRAYGTIDEMMYKFPWFPNRSEVPCGSRGGGEAIIAIRSQETPSHHSFHRFP